MVDPIAKIAIQPRGPSGDLRVNDHLQAVQLGNPRQS